MKKVNLSRRGFLKATGLAGSGLVLGFHWTGCTPDGTPAEIAKVVLEPNAYIKILSDGMVTLMSPVPEIGQGIKTAIPMIVAEELDVSWDQVKVEQAPLAPDLYIRQAAGGSQAIRQLWTSVRTAGAAGRRMLMEAAAREWQVPMEELTTNEGVIHHEKSNQSVTYGDIATKAADIEVPEEVELKDPKDFKIIGTSPKNVDVYDIVKGNPLFGMDMKKEGAVIAMITHPPAFGMRPKSVDDSAARAIPGIKDVFTITAFPADIDTPWTGNNAFPELVVVTGENTWNVMKAKKALKIEWETVTPGENTADHISKMEEQINAPLTEPDRIDGDPDAAFKKADKIIERTYSAPFLPHNTMEPMNFYANVTGDKVEFEGPTQTPQRLRDTTAKIFGIPEENIKVNMLRAGGGFGRRLYGHYGVEAAQISKKIGAPVKLIYTREDDMTQGTYRPDYRVKYKAGIDAEGNLIALTVIGTGTSGGPVVPNRFPAGAVDNYAAKNYSLDSNITTGAWRAPRSNFIAGAEQSFLDEVAEACGKDPMDFRLELFERSKTDPVGEKNDYDPDRFITLLKMTKEKCDWDNVPSGVSRGLSAYYCHNSYIAQIVDVEMRDGKPMLQKAWCGVDCGIVINKDGAINQVEGGILDGIGHAMYGNITFNNGVIDQQNFDKYRLIRFEEAPEAIETFFVDNGIDPTGLGEPAMPPIPGALANALYRATGKRLYHQPYIFELEDKDIDLG
ncbi:MAG: molybdopterin-dependent oxidoreductase [Cyclobacteriaceae bacterium]|nr:molybdopterin-dependent oxidoreductase [Cyclobacteriaceae bacterium]